MLRRNKGKEDDQLAVVIADMKRRSPTSAELPPDVNAFDDAATWASQVRKCALEGIFSWMMKRLRVHLRSAATRRC